ncbi:hypothetical protein MiSe_16610 [Microseira wollei NIES-4236]|uniref:Transposase n=1 Tax=Microseira wollei NIES-4236 TaxID=2530354 RepID=A0AAV3WFT1_9CYAN|nr:hypothetical protein MiSe_16610 [Microseira wollei NIES-4236]
MMVLHSLRRFDKPSCPYSHSTEALSGQTPCVPRSLSFTRTISLGFMAIADQLEIFLPRSLMCLRQAYNRYFEVSLAVPYSRVGQRPYLL